MQEKGNSLNNSDKVTLTELMFLLGEPTRIEGDEYLWQCPDCLDTGKNNLKFNARKVVLSCMSDKDNHKSVYAKIMKMRKEIEKAEKNLPNKDKPVIKVTSEMLKKFNADVLAKPKALEFIHKKRGITQDTVKDLKIGYCNGQEVNVSQDSCHWVFPAFNQDGMLIGAEFRHPEFIEYRPKQKLFHTHNLGRVLCKINPNIEGKNAIFTEGFIDGILMYQWLKENNIHTQYDIFTGSNGASSIVTLLDAFDFSEYEKVIFCLDKDKNTDPTKKSMKGVEAMNAIKAKIKHVIYDMHFDCKCCKDFNDYYVKHNPNIDILNNAEVLNKKQKSFIQIATIYDQQVLDRYKHPERYPKLPLGIDGLDCLLKGGVETNEIFGILARPSMGKTSFMITLASNMNSRGYKIGFVSLEMSSWSIVEKLQFNMLRLSQDDILESFNMGLNYGMAKVENFTKIVDGLGFYICDDSNLSLGSISDQLLNDFGEKGVDAIFVDHMNLVEPNKKDGDYKKNLSSYERATEVYNSLRGFVKNLGIPVFAACQLNRSLETRQNKRPMLSDVLNSGAGEAIFDAAVGLYRHHYYDPSLPETKRDAEIILCKNRRGDTGTIDAKFFGEHSLFREKTDVERNNQVKPDRIKKTNSLQYFDDDDDDFD